MGDIIRDTLREKPGEVKIDFYNYKPELNVNSYTDEKEKVIQRETAVLMKVVPGEDIVF